METRLNRERENRIKDLLERGVKEGVYPGAVLLAARGGRISFFGESGYLSLMPERVPMERTTIFDLASLTKPLATTMALMKLVNDGKADLDQRISDFIPISSHTDKKDLTLRLILSHSAGFTDWKPYYLDLVKHEPRNRKTILREWIMKEPLSYRPGKDCIYSDLGFMALEWVVERISGTTLKDYVDLNFYKPLALENTFLHGGSQGKGLEKEAFAATEDCPWRGKIMQGEVHDENAYAVGGYSGHAGLFGIAGDLFILLNILREHHCRKREDYFKPETVVEFFRRQDIVKGSSWALGWDTPSPVNSSSGVYFSAESVGHLGFAGTSIWMDLEKGIIVIFLTNRVHPTRDNQKIKSFRPLLHNLVMEGLSGGRVPA